MAASHHLLEIPWHAASCRSVVVSSILRLWCSSRQHGGHWDADSWTGLLLLFWEQLCSLYPLVMGLSHSIASLMLI
jgi:hypothetical protein